MAFRMASRAYQTEAIVLKRLNFGEADRVLTLYTRRQGKIKALAKGVRRVASRKGGNVEVFNHVVLYLAKGKNLDLVTEAQVSNAFKSWRKDLKKIGLAYYFCELVDKLTAENQPNQAVFDLLKNYLARISQVKGWKIVREFEEALLEELGFGVPEAIKRAPGSLKTYIEEIIEKKIKTPKIIRQFLSLD